MNGFALGDQQAFIALEWLKGDLLDQQARLRQALEQYARQREDPEPLVRCQQELQQQRGVFLVLELHGAALLAEEMAQLAAVLASGQTADPDEALAALIQAVLQLPVYLEQVRAGRRDRPMLLLPLLNELRASRGEALLSAGSLFLPDSGPRPAPLSPAALARLDRETLPASLRKLRQTLQVALVALFRGQAVAEHLQLLARVFSYLEKYSQNTPCAPLWLVASAVVEGLQAAQIADGVAVRGLLRALDQSLKSLIGLGVQGFNQPPPESLLKNLLFYIASSSARTPRIQAVRQAWHLDRALAALDDPEAAAGPGLRSPDQATRRSVVLALREELVRLKEQLDLLARGQPGAGGLAGLPEPLQRITDALAVLGLGVLRRQLLEPLQQIRQWLAAGQQPGTSPLLDIASQLLAVESALVSQAGLMNGLEDEDEPPPPLTDLQYSRSRVFRAVQETLEQVRAGILAFVAAHWNRQALQGLPGLLDRSRGALVMLELYPPAAILRCCGQYLQERLDRASSQPDWAQLDALAETLGALDFYLDCLVDDSATPDDGLLAIARSSLLQLGFTGPLDAGLARQPLDIVPETDRGVAVAVAPPVAMERPPVPPAAPSGPPALPDVRLLAIFCDEARLHRQVIEDYLAQYADSLARPVTDALLRALHTLNGCARSAGLAPVERLASALEQRLKACRQQQRPLAMAELELLRQFSSLLLCWLDSLENGQPPASLEGDAGLTAQLAALPDPVGPVSSEAGIPASLSWLQQLEEAVVDWHQQPGKPPLPGLHQALQQLVQMAGPEPALAPVLALCLDLQQLLARVDSGEIPPDQAFFILLDQGVEALLGMFDQQLAGQALSPCSLVANGLPALRYRARPVRAEAVPVPVPQVADPDQAIRAVFLEEALELQRTLARTFSQWQQDPEDPALRASLQRDLHTLKGSARVAGVSAVGDLAHGLESLYETLASGHLPVTPALAGLLQRCHDGLARQLDELQAGQPARDPAGLLAAIQQQLAVPAAPRPPAGPAPRPELMARLAAVAEAWSGWWPDPESSPRLLHQALQQLEMAAHEARLAPLADLARALADRYQALEAPASPALLELLARAHEVLGRLQQQLVADQPLAGTAPLVDELAAFRPAPAAVPAPESPPALPGLPFSRPPAAAVQQPAEGGGMVRVPARLLEQLADLAGEAAISRTRISQQLRDSRGSLAEMDLTIGRIRDQLRALDTAAQGQMLSHYREAPGSAFDPLELDRHAALQQLSSSLFEAASDLVDLRETLQLRSREAELLLDQQARISGALQDGLQQTRLEPFARIVPRLQRLVRQLADELGKPVQLLEPVSPVALDRGQLDALVAPLEHLLRNAMDHGIEQPAQRQQAGKAVPGTLRLVLQREGNALVLCVEDDGAGVDRAAVRQRAEASGLLQPGQPLEDAALLQLVFEPGFSTARQLTQISGRGVGLDVVRASVQQLGGSVWLESVPGQGSRVVIRLPVTASAGRALMVHSAGARYALPLTAVEGILRCTAAELEAATRAGPPGLLHQGRHYQLHDLGELLDLPAAAGPARSRPWPVILVRSGETALALQVEALGGSRDLVVQPLAPPFAGLPGVAGASLLGEGDVVLVLDPVAAWHAFQRRPVRPPAVVDALVPLHGPQPRVLVVDDSVTVRKVTRRLLERHGLAVLTARDGLDALQLLQRPEPLPDLLLLDIEMPRMDGYELTRRIRREPALQALPVIMVSSRTGPKHRAQALAAGANACLGKPCPEDELLAALDPWLHGALPVPASGEGEARDGGLH